MSKNLVISRGTLRKVAQGEPGEGPSFEQQFGILANAQITDKYPALGPYKVLFQLQDKSDDNLFAVGAAVYKLGSNFTYVPAVFKKGKIWTGVIQYVPSMQRFLPLSDAWLSYVKNHNVDDYGDTIPGDQSQDIATGAQTARAKQTTDPFMKTASKSDIKYIMQSQHYTQSILDTTLKMGKRASQLLLDKLNQPDYLNGALAFYNPQQLATFAKKAALNFAQIRPYVVTIMDKRAKELSQEQKTELFRDGFIVKTASRVTDDQAKNHVDVIKVSNPRTSFIRPSESCKCQALTADGNLKQVTLIKTIKDMQTSCMIGSGICMAHTFGVSRDISAKSYIKNNSGIDYNIITQNGCYQAPADIMILASSIQQLDFTTIGEPLSSVKQIPFNSILVTPSGTSIKIKGFYQSDGNGSFFNYNTVIRQSKQDDLIKPIASGSLIQVPKGSRVIKPSKQHSKEQFALNGSIDSIIRKFIDKNYDKIKVYSDGQQFAITSSKQDGTNRYQIKQAALNLVTDYNISPANAKTILKDLMLKCAGKVSAVQSYYLSKQAAIHGDASSWQQANIGYSVKQQDQPQVSKTDLNNYAQNDANIMQNIQTAVDSGVKQVFDMQVLKLLIATADPRDQVSNILPDLLNCIDKLCRILFLYHCHTQDMQQQYGAVKMQSLSKSLQNTLKDLSQLTVFLKLRGLSSDTNNNPDVGDLQTGSYL